MGSSLVVDRVNLLPTLSTVCQSRAGDRLTVLTGDAMDQGRHFGVLDQVRNFGLELLSVEELDP